jgi:O-antigen ligase
MAGLLFLWRFPNVGIVALIIAALLVPFSIATGSQTGLSAAVLLLGLLLGLWLLDVVVNRRGLSLFTLRPVKPLVAFVVIAIMAYGFGQLSWLPISPAPQPAQLAGLAIFALSVGAFLLVAHQVQRQSSLELMTWVYLGLSAVYIAGRIVPQWEQYTVARFVPQATGGMFWTWLIALAFSQAAFNHKLPTVWRLALGALVIGTLYVSAVLARGWTSGWLPAIVALVVASVARSQKRGLAIILIAGALILLARQTVVGAVVIGDTQYSIDTRLAAWRVLFEVIKLSPIFGLGPANYYWYSSLFPILGYYVPFNSHNNYVDIVAQTGVLGLLCFTWFAVELARFGWRLRLQVPEGFARAYVYGALGGLAGTLVAAALGDWVLPFVYNVGLNGFRASVLAWLFLGGLVALAQIHKTGSVDSSRQTMGEKATRSLP